MTSPLESLVLFYLGPVPITLAVVTTWGIMIILITGAFLLTRQLDLTATKRQAALELLVDTIDNQIRETSGAEPAPYRGFIGSLFLFILIANCHLVRHKRFWRQRISAIFCRPQSRNDPT